MADWIKKGASKHPGKFAAKAKRAGKTTLQYARTEKGAGGTLGKEANYAKNAISVARNKHKSKLYG